MALLKIKDLNYYYPNQERKNLDEVNLEIEEGEFVLLIGGSGSGKSTLLRSMCGLVPEFYGGKISGDIEYGDRNINQIDKKEKAEKYGILFQNPENQIVMTKVIDEIAFGLENLGVSENLIKRRIMEVSSALNLNAFLERNTPALSGGIKQKVALASVMALQPKVLLLDEPTSQLDPVAGEEILTMVRRLNEDNGLTIVLIEQRLERCFHLADRFIVMENGKVIKNTKDVSELAYWATSRNSPFIPPIAKLFSKAGLKDIPLTVKQGRSILLEKYAGKEGVGEGRKTINNGECTSQNPCIVEIKNLWFTYDDGTEVIKNLSMNIHKNDFLIIMGENSAGKTTLIKNIIKLKEKSRGRIKLADKDIEEYELKEISKLVGYLPQNPSEILVKDTLREELEFSQAIRDKVDEEKMKALTQKLGIYKYLESNPRDLSTGEIQRCALASVLVTEPEILILDEPTRGLDYELKKELGEILIRLSESEKTIILITHDVEFAAEYGKKVCILSKGEVIECGDKKEILKGSTFYSTQINKLFRDIDNDVFTFEEGIEFFE